MVIVKRRMVGTSKMAVNDELWGAWPRNLILWASVVFPSPQMHSEPGGGGVARMPVCLQLCKERS